jgi:hypothetical protein
MGMRKAKQKAEMTRTTLRKHWDSISVSSFRIHSGLGIQFLLCSQLAKDATVGACDGCTQEQSFNGADVGLHLRESMYPRI